MEFILPATHVCLRERTAIALPEAGIPQAVEPHEMIFERMLAQVRFPSARVLELERVYGPPPERGFHASNDERVPSFCINGHQTDAFDLACRHEGVDGRHVTHNRRAPRAERIAETDS